MKHGVARADQDVASHQILISGATTVHTNFRNTCFVGSVNAHGVPVIAGSPNVFVENKPIARESDAMADSGNITTSSLNVVANG
jgi:uncharacterized Zn-binding protein involved in type VI secretion